MSYTDLFSKNNGDSNDVTTDNPERRASSQEQTSNTAPHSVDLGYISPDLFPYDNIYVILATWKDDNLRHQETDDLRKCFQSMYKARCYPHTIPYDDAQASLLTKIQDVSQRAQNGYNLVIVYYGGDSTGSGGQFVLSSTQPQSHIKWEAIRGAFATANVDVLFLLDCAYMGSTEEHKPQELREILAIHHSPGQAGSNSSRSLTQSLLRALQSYKGQPITVTDLYKSIKQPEPADDISHIVLSQGGLSEITIAVATNDPAVAQRTGATSRQITLNVEYEPGQRPPDREQEEKLIAGWLDTTLPQYASLQSSPGKSENKVAYRFQVGRSVTADFASWQPLAQSKPGNVRDLNLNVNSFSQRNKGKAAVTQDPLHDLVESLAINQEIKSNFPTRSGRYKNVSVLPIMWEKVEKWHKLNEELEKLRAIFADKYHFEVDPIFTIPSRLTASTELNGYVSRKIEQNNDPEKLLIVVYSGHGLPYDKTWDNDEGPMMIADTAWGRKYLDWDKILYNLLAASCDVVVLMNCCYAGHATLAPVLGTNDILAATDRDTQAQSGERSFLGYVIEVLKKEREGDKISIADLERELDYLNSAYGGQKLAKPMRKIHPEGRKSIVLKPLDLDPDSSSSAYGDPATNAAQVQGSFFVEFVLEDPAEASQIDWYEFFGGSRYPDRIKRLEFYTAPKLRKKLSRGDQSGTATPSMLSKILG